VIHVPAVLAHSLYALALTVPTQASLTHATHRATASATSSGALSLARYESAVFFSERWARAAGSLEYAGAVLATTAASSSARRPWCDRGRNRGLKTQHESQ
jgi:hypothetical protein